MVLAHPSFQARGVLSGRKSSILKVWGGDFSISRCKAHPAPTRIISIPVVRSCRQFPVILPFASIRPFSVLNRPPPQYDGHIPLNVLERGVLATGSAVISLLNPRRGDLIATLGETTATPYFIYRLRDAMLSNPTGRRILRDRPRITSQNMSTERLRKLPANSVGHAYVSWLDREGVSPDTRCSVKYIDDPESAYVMQRYRECHDFFHAVTGLPVFVEGEVALKAFEFANTLLPMTALSLFAVTRMKPQERERFWETYLPWALHNGFKSKDIINVYWEEELETDVEELRSFLGIEKPPDLRETRDIIKRRQKAARETMQ